MTAGAVMIIHFINAFRIAVPAVAGMAIRMGVRTTC
jgi:hypothetical protein